MTHPAAKYDIVPAVRTLSKVYAKAIFAAAQTSGRTLDLIEELEAFVVEVLDPHPEFEERLEAARLTPEQKDRLIERILWGSDVVQLRTVLHVLAERSRVRYLRPIVRALRAEWEDFQGLVRAEVTTAVPLGEEQTRQIEQTLREALKKEPRLDLHVRPEILGGMVVRVKDTVFDGSVQTRLEKVRQQLIQESVHEIQSRRDRFGDPEGN